VQGNDSIKFATSILDYVFRELAVSYMERFDLAHVDPTGEGFDALGKGVEEGRPATEGRYVSKGLTRSRTDRLKVMQGGADLSSPSPAGGGSVSEANRGGVGEAGRGGTVSNVTSLSSASPRGEISGSTALKAEPEQKLSPTQALEQMQWTKTDAKAVAAERRAEAKAKGYEGEMCSECLNFTLVRNGTCLKCDTCGSTTGCS
jgi:ribonucleoside-diphosphate reductase alpha chain